MIPRDDDDPSSPSVAQSCNRLVVELLRLGGRIERIVDIPGKEETVHIFGLGDKADLLHHLTLFLQPFLPLQFSAEMPVGRMQELHVLQIIAKG